MILLLLFFQATWALPTGFKTSVSQAGLNYLKDVGMQVLQQKFGTVTIPDQSGEAGTPIGKIDWDIKGLVMDRITFPQTSLQLEPGVGMLIVINGASAHIRCDWHYRKKHWPHVSDHGSADISVSQLNVNVNLKLTMASGLPHAQVLSDSVNLGHLDIKLHGGASWLYNLFIGLFRNSIKHSIANAIEKAIVTNINDGLNKAFSKLPITHAINHDVEIDYELVDNPIFTAPCLTLPELGEFYSISKPSECPSTVCPTPPLPNQVTGSMVEFMISEYVGNSASYVFFNRNDLRIEITNEMVPKWSPITLNTSTWEFLLPPLYAKFPNKLMVLELYAVSPPQLVFSSSGISVVVNGELDVNVLAPTPTPAFSLSVLSQLSASAAINGTQIVGTLRNATANFKLKSSQIGPFDLTLIDEILNTAIQKGLVPIANSVLQKGFGIPVIPGVQFINPTMSENNGFIAISTSFRYTPSH